MLLLSTLVALGSGCGTMANLDGRTALVGWPSRPPAPFGGVANDMNWMRTAELCPPDRFDKDFAFMIGLSDLPFSFVADVVTLPWVGFEYTRESIAPTGRYEKPSMDSNGAAKRDRKRSEASEDAD
jgi:uncharacterized protein YceK